MSARGELTKFLNKKLRAKNLTIEGRIQERLLAAYGIQVSRKSAWTWLAKEYARVNGIDIAVIPKRKAKKPRPVKPNTPKVDFYKSREWRSARYDALRKNDGCCCVCGRSAKDGIILHVDHIIPRSKAPHLELDRANLQVMCDDCNLGKSNRCDRDWR